jgi:hypothetical protein
MNKNDEPLWTSKKIDKLNKKAYVSGTGIQGKLRKWKNAGSCS